MEGKNQTNRGCTGRILINKVNKEKKNGMKNKKNLQISQNKLPVYIDVIFLSTMSTKTK